MELDAIAQRFELDSLRGRPDGPVEYIEALGMEVPTYIDPRKDLLPQTVKTTLMYHVPLNMRGPYKVHSRYTEGPHGERLGEGNYCMCCGVNKSDSGSRKVGTTKRGADCANKAINYSGYCSWHGGALHPLDKSVPTLTREAAFKAGKLPVEDMDDEELARGQIRRADGTWTQYRNIPSTVFQQAQQELFKRADIKLRENLTEVVEVVTQMAKGTAYEPEVRLRAATWVFERVRGKNPDIVVHTQDKPFEILMTEAVLGGGSRASSRAQRGLENAVDAEVVSIDPYIENEMGRGDSSTVEYAGEMEDEVELVPLTPEIPEHHGMAGMPITTPPTDPLLRHRWEQDKAENEADAELSVAELKATLDAARRKRYAARAKGLDHIETHPYTWDCRVEWIPDPEDPEYEKAVYRTRFIEPVLPKVPREVKAADTRRMKRMR